MYLGTDGKITIGVGGAMANFAADDASFNGTYETTINILFKKL
jgi:hypothetical protein